MSRLCLPGVAVAVLLAAMAPTPVTGSTYDKLAYLTFSAPVQIPGATLNAGTYRFHLTNPETSRNVLQVLSNDGSVVYAMFHTTPDRRTTLTEDPLVTFRETPAGVAPAVRSLFYGGEYRGYEFVYPKGEPNMIPEALPQPEIAYTPLPAVSEPAVEPEVEAAEPAPTPEVAADPVAEPVPEPPPAELPRTASPLPLIAVGALTSLVAGLGLRARRRRDG